MPLWDSTESLLPHARNTRSTAILHFMNGIRKYASGQSAICELHVCNMRMVSMQYANGIHAICELHLFLLRKELSFTVNIYFSVITFSRTNAILSHDLFPATNSFPNKFRIPVTLSLSDTGILILTCPISLPSSTIETSVANHAVQV